MKFTCREIRVVYCGNCNKNYVELFTLCCHNTPLSALFIDQVIKTGLNSQQMPFLNINKLNEAVLLKINMTKFGT